MECGLEVPVYPFLTCAHTSLLFTLIPMTGDGESEFSAINFRGSPCLVAAFYETSGDA